VWNCSENTLKNGVTWERCTLFADGTRILPLLFKLPTHTHTHTHIYIYIYIISSSNSSSNLSDDRSTASSKTIPPLNAI
jgi:hypothetical protein